MTLVQHTVSHPSTAPGPQLSSDIKYYTISIQHEYIIIIHADNDIYIHTFVHTSIYSINLYIINNNF